MTIDQIERAATAMKVLHLAQLPGMDLVAVRLNAQPTDREMRLAEMWAHAFELSEVDVNPYNVAARLANEGRL